MDKERLVEVELFEANCCEFVQIINYEFVIAEDSSGWVLAVVLDELEAWTGHRMAYVLEERLRSKKSAIKSAEGWARQKDMERHSRV